MKMLISFVLLTVLFLCFLNCSTPEKNPLEGTWQMVSGKYVTPSTTVECNEKTRLCYKIIGANHFSVVEMYRAKPDSAFFAATGRYKDEGKTYTEILEICSNANMVGISNVFESTLANDTWRIYRKTQDSELDETWVKVKNVM
jgi:hypothetical protein